MDKLLQDFKVKSYVDIFGMVYEMRMARCLMVQTEVCFPNRGTFSVQNVWQIFAVSTEKSRFQ